MRDPHIRTRHRGEAPSAAAPIQILVADSDADTRALHCAAFRLAGCEIIEAADGRDALTRALTQPPSLVLTEIRLPLIDGYALCDILRRDQATAAVPILVVTADGSPVSADRVRAAGANAVLVKPTAPDQVLAETTRLLTDAKHVAERASAVAPLDSAKAAPQRTPRARLSKSFARFTTTTPPAPPPALVCPLCDRRLAYEHSHVGGVSARNPEQWDDYTCPSCGAFQYRHRTRKLRPAG